MPEALEGTGANTLTPQHYFQFSSVSLFFTFAVVSSPHPILDPSQWVSRYADELFRYALCKTGNTDLSEDLVQDTFLAALDAASGFRGQSSERTWLYAILKFRIAGHYRKASTSRELRMESEAEAGDLSDTFFTSDGSWRPQCRPKNWLHGHGGDLENKELSQAIQHCIDNLSVPQKQLVVLKLIEEIEVSDICKELGISASNYWVIIHRAKLRLRACLEQNWLKL